MPCRLNAAALPGCEPASEEECLGGNCVGTVQLSTIQPGKPSWLETLPSRLDHKYQQARPTTQKYWLPRGRRSHTQLRLQTSKMSHSAAAANFQHRTTCSQLPSANTRRSISPQACLVWAPSWGRIIYASWLGTLGRMKGSFSHAASPTSGSYAA